MSLNVKFILDSAAKFAREMELLDAETKTRTKQAIERGTRAVVAKAKARAPKRSGELAYSVRAEFSKNGMVGYAKAGFGKLLRRSRAATQKGQERAQRRGEQNKLNYALANNSRQALSSSDIGVYAPVVERGDPRRHHRPHPFMIPSLAEEKPTIIQDLADAPIKAAKGLGLT